MLMRTKSTDYSHVDPEHRKIDERLHNWARWVTPRTPHWVHPMWRKSRSAQHWEPVNVSVGVDPLDGMAMEKAVQALPSKHKEAIRWCYVYCSNPLRMCKALGVSREGLAELIREGRQMLVNRRV